jgi:tetratricopeptide (TPR) repeat protein
MLKGISSGLVVVCSAGFAFSPAIAQHCSPDWTAAYRCMNGCGGCPANGGNRQGPSQPSGPSPEEIAHQQRIAASREYNVQGIAAHARGDLAEAVRLFQLAVDNDPDDSVLADNLAKAKALLQAQIDSKVASANIHAMMQQYTNSVAPVSAGGLDFDGAAGGSAPPSGLDFMPAHAAVTAATKPEVAVKSPAAGCGSPDSTMVVNACHVPSGLPEAIEAEIPSTPAGDRVRKGFEAIANHDWKLARAWFGDALNHDPGNAGIARLLDLASYTYKREQQGSIQEPTATSAKMDAAESAEVNAVMDRQMSEDESHTTAKGAADSEDAAANAAIDQALEANEVDRLVDEGLADDEAHRFAEYNSSHDLLPRAATSRSPAWAKFMQSLFTPNRSPRRPGPVAAVRG